MLSQRFRPSFVFFRALLLIATMTAASLAARGQSAKPAQEPSAPEAGGPDGAAGSIALPKKKEKPPEPPPAAAEPSFKNPEGTPNFTLRIDVPEVTVDVGVLIEKTRTFVPGLKPGNFRVYEDGVPQTILGFKRIEAPITALMLCEFASKSYSFLYDMRNAAWAFAQQLRPQDYVALMTYDLNTHLLLDFTQDKQTLQQAISSLIIPGLSETNLFDALYESLDRLSRIEGRKYIVLISSGRDTFSRLNYDKILQKLRSTPDVTIFTVSTGGGLRAMTEGDPGWGAQMRDLDYLQADNQMRTFAAMTGGASYFPRFPAEMPDIFNTINASIRSKYQIVYHPTNAKQDGTFRKLRVELVDGEGHPLRIQDEKQRPLKYSVIARDGYRARQQVE